MWPTIQHHIGEELGLVDLTSLGAGNSDSYRDFLLHQIRKIVVGTVTRRGLCIEISGLVRPRYSPVNKKRFTLCSFVWAIFASWKHLVAASMSFLLNTKRKLAIDVLLLAKR
jgi:hypothetical protein